MLYTSPYIVEELLNASAQVHERPHAGKTILHVQ